MSDLLFQNSQNKQGSKIISLIKRNPCLKNIHCILHSSMSSCNVNNFENRAECSNFLHHIQLWTDLSSWSWEITQEIQLLCINKSHILGHKNTQPMQIPESPHIRKLLSMSEMINRHMFQDHFDIQCQNIHLSYIIS